MGSQNFGLIWSYTGCCLIWLLQFKCGYVFTLFSQPTLRMKSPEPLLLINCPCLKAGEFARDQNKERFLQGGAPSTGGWVLQSFEDRGCNSHEWQELFMLSLRQWRILRTKRNWCGLLLMIYLFLWWVCECFACRYAHALCVFLHGGWKNMLGVLKLQWYTVVSFHVNSVGTFYHWAITLAPRWLILANSFYRIQFMIN